MLNIMAGFLPRLNSLAFPTLPMTLGPQAKEVSGVFPYLDGNAILPEEESIERPRKDPGPHGQVLQATDL